MNKIKIYGHSDDTMIWEVWESDNHSSDEKYGNCTFVINSLIKVVLHHDNLDGWKMTISILNENVDINEFYKIKIHNSENRYSPVFELSTDLDIKIEGIYGDTETKLKEYLWDALEDMESGEDSGIKLMKDLEEKGFITINK